MRFNNSIEANEFIFEFKAITGITLWRFLKPDTINGIFNVQFWIK